MKPMILVTAPVKTRSGYGNHSRDICRALIESDKYVLIDHDTPFYEPGLHIYKAQLMLNIASWLVISSIGIIVIGIFVSFFTIIASTIKGTNIEKPNVTRIVANPLYIIPLIFCISIISEGISTNPYSLPKLLAVSIARVNASSLKL